MARLFGSKLKYLRDSQGWTQEAMAQLLGFKRQGHISNLELGRKEPSLELVVRVADLFGVTTDYLIRDDVAVEISLPDVLPDGE